MRKKEYNKYSMYKSVLMFFKSLDEKLCSIPALKQSVCKFTELIAQISELDIQYTTVSKGATSHKKAKRSELITETEKFCGVLFVHGKNTGDANIESIANIKLRALNKMRDPELLLTTKKISTILNTTREALIEYGISENMIIDYGEIVNGFDQSLKNARSCKINSIIARKRLSETFVEADKLLKDDLDKLMKLIPECTIRYQVARRVKHIGVRHKTQKENVTEEELVSEENSTAIYQTDLFSNV